ncbi:MAG: hypothetical protein M3430_17480 [Acidobacteriota bacterium]|nr:hypothetical protein [Acidobacteriota bacterium]
MRGMIICLVAAAACLSFSHEVDSTWKCLIPPKSVEGALKNSAAVFVGEVVKVTDAGNLSKARLKVIVSWKGAEAKEVVVMFNDNHAESPHYRVGQSYLVFAGVSDGKLVTGPCSRTRQLEYAQEDLKQLDARKKPKEEKKSGRK